MFLIVDLETVFRMEFVVLIMVCVHTKFHMPSSNSSLVIAIKPRTKYRCRAAGISLHYILQNELS